MIDFDLLRFRWAHHLAVFRGATAACAVIGLVPNISDLSRWEFLRAVKAIALSWNDFTSYIGLLIGFIPFLPDLSYIHINIIIITLAFAPTALYSILISTDNFGSNLPGAVLFIALIFLFFTPPTMFLIYSEELYFFITLFTITPAAIFSIAILKGYRYGFLFIFSFAIVFTFAYHLNAPWLTSFINQFVCARKPLDC